MFTRDNKIMIADTETKTIRELFSPKVGEVRSPFVSRDGRLLYYSVHISESDVWMLDRSADQ